MKYTGVILAAGEATRMPNKCLLPLSRGETNSWVIMDSARLFVERSLLRMKSDETEKLLVVTPRSTLNLWALRSTQFNTWRYVNQPRGRGVVDAVMRAAMTAREGMLLVAFGDNVYPSSEVCESLHAPGATVRSVDQTKYPWAKELDAYMTYEKKWVGRPGPAKSLSLAGWAVFHVEYLMNLEEEPKTLVDLLNTLNIQPREYSANGWCDCGTEEGYMTYLETGGVV